MHILLCNIVYMLLYLKRYYRVMNLAEFTYRVSCDVTINRRIRRQNNKKKKKLKNVLLNNYAGFARYLLGCE